MRASTILERIDAVVVGVLKWFTISIFLAISVILTANVVNRYLPFASLHWMDEIVEMLFASLVFYGAAATWILKGHFTTGNWIEKRLGHPRLKAGFRLVTDGIAVAFIILFFIYSLDLVRKSLELTAVFQIPRKLLYSCMPASFGIMALYSVRFLVFDVIGIISPRVAAALAGNMAGGTVSGPSAPGVTPKGGPADG
jgi:TRAP-type C4-dicarboxylate transport system permease small subunit